MTPFLLLWSAWCGFTVISFCVYIFDPEAEDKQNLFWRFGCFYDKFFFNHGEPTAALPPPDKKDEKLVE